MISIGVTGTHLGPTDAQREQLKLILMNVDMYTLHHGDCVGVDAIAHALAREKRVQSHCGYPKITLHPPNVDDKRAFCADADEEWAPEPYLARDKGIVYMSNLLIAVPHTAEEQLRSGTWATVRYARRFGRLIIRLNPDGSVALG